MSSPLNDPKLEALLDRLHAQSDAQTAETNAAFERREGEISIDQEGYYDNDLRRFLADKLVALDRDKALFCYLLCRSLMESRHFIWQLLSGIIKSRMEWSLGQRMNPPKWKLLEPISGKPG